MSDSPSDSEQSFSDDEQVTWEKARRFKIVFGKRYNGKRLASMIKSKKRRDYLKYILSWDKVRPDTAANIRAALDQYGEMKIQRSDPKPAKPRKNL